MKVYELLDSSDKWTQEYYARDMNNNAMSLQDVGSTQACKWCLVGAIYKCYVRDEAAYFVRKLIKVIDMNIVDFNDSSTYEDVYNLCKRLDI